MANEGVRALTNLIFPTAIDASWLANLALQDGTTLDAVLLNVDAALDGVNAEMARRYSEIVHFTDRLEVLYRQGVSNGLQVHTEFGRPIDYRASTTGHSLAYKEYDRGLGWTWDYLRKAWAYQIEADVADLVKDILDKFEAMLIRRCLNDAEDTGAANGVGTGYSVPWCLTSASATVSFTPPAVNGKTFSSTHDHFLTDTGGWDNDVFKNARLELKEHGHEPPFIMWVSDLDESTIKGLTDFVPIEPVGVQFGTATDRAVVGSQYIGVCHDFYIRVVPRVPQYYGIGFKSYGANSARNPIYCRVEKGQARPWARLISQNQYTTYPIENMMSFVGFGFGVGDRTAGVAIYTNNATWADASVTGADS